MLYVLFLLYLVITDPRDSPGECICEVELSALARGSSNIVVLDSRLGNCKYLNVVLHSVLRHAESPEIFRLSNDGHTSMIQFADLPLLLRPLMRNFTPCPVSAVNFQYLSVYPLFTAKSTTAVSLASQSLTWALV